MIIKKALFSLNNCTRANEFAQTLIESGWQIIASRRTGQFLETHQVSITKLADFVNLHEDYGFSPTLHPKIEFNLTSGNPSKDSIDLVYLISYPLSQGNDVGGHALLALAAKGKRIPVFTITDMDKVVTQIQQHGDITPAYHQQLIKKTYQKVIRHYSRLAKSYT